VRSDQPEFIHQLVGERESVDCCLHTTRWRTMP
jgi:hypothetical protein